MSESGLRHNISAKPLNCQLWTDNGVILMKAACSEPLMGEGRQHMEAKHENVFETISVVPLESVHRDAAQDLSLTREGNEEKEEFNFTLTPRAKLVSITSEEEKECRICQSRGEERLNSPCYCAGSTKWVHESCLVKWLRVSETSKCELCSQNIIIKKSTKPVCQWQCPSGGLTGGPCEKVDLWYGFVTLFSLCTVLGFAIFQLRMKASDAQTLGVFTVIYILCGLMILVRIRYFYHWFVKRSVFWKKWKVLNEQWTLAYTGPVSEPSEVSVV